MFSPIEEVPASQQEFCLQRLVLLTKSTRYQLHPWIRSNLRIGRCESVRSAFCVRPTKNFATSGCLGSASQSTESSPHSPIDNLSHNRSLMKPAWGHHWRGDTYEWGHGGRGETPTWIFASFAPLDEAEDEQQEQQQHDGAHQADEPTLGGEAPLHLHHRWREGERERERGGVGER